MPFFKKYFYQSLAILVILICWKFAASYVNNGLLLPAPEKVLIDFFRLISSSAFYDTLGTTLLRGFLGFLIAFILAALVGIPAGIFGFFYNFFNPIIVLLRSTPVISFILLALIWFGPDNVPVFIAILTMFPLLCKGFISGIQNTDKELVDMANIYKVRRKRILSGLYFPSLLPFLFNGISNAMGFGWRAVIIGEVLSQPRWGLGTEMQVAQTYLLVSRLICWSVVAVFMAFLFEWALGIIEKRSLKWKQI
jgi:NitT/TauT family transport system permease protein